MAEVFRYVNRKKLTKVIAQCEETQEGLDLVVSVIAVEAAGMLAQHHHEGHAEIKVTEGRIDRYVELNDERGLKAAMSIEYGREHHYVNEVGQPAGGMEGLFILHRAAALPRRLKKRLR